MWIFLYKKINIFLFLCFINSLVWNLVVICLKIDLEKRIFFQTFVC